jgi:alkylation response protein AidB-like acyl-CoA dehydrogenase
MPKSSKDYSAARLQSSMVKAYWIDAGLRVVGRSMQILGGRGLAIDDFPFSDPRDIEQNDLTSDHEIS